MKNETKQLRIQAKRRRYYSSHDVHFNAPIATEAIFRAKHGSHNHTLATFGIGFIANRMDKS